ncbi:hypothetical protein C8Q73DRAFT_74493 [Cubamyces lactineus]|nr:hypothetical protein C8Q73DRAFT_74493 [Cubamyces lactineus]
MTAMRSNGRFGRAELRSQSAGWWLPSAMRRRCIVLCGPSGVISNQITQDDTVRTPFSLALGRCTGPDLSTGRWTSVGSDCGSLRHCTTWPGQWSCCCATHRALRLRGPMRTRHVVAYSQVCYSQVDIPHNFSTISRAVCHDGDGHLLLTQWGMLHVQNTRGPPCSPAGCRCRCRRCFRCYCRCCRCQRQRVQRRSVLGG